MPIEFTYRPPRINGIAKMALAKHAAEEAGAEVLLEASLPLVPRDTDMLADSGHVAHDALGAMVVYDAASDDGYPYGIVQHEDTSLHHPHGGEAKYLERPMHSDGAAILAAMAAAARART